MNYEFTNNTHASKMAENSKWPLIVVIMVFLCTGFITCSMISYIFVQQRQADAETQAQQHWASVSDRRMAFVREQSLCDDPGLLPDTVSPSSSCLLALASKHGITPAQLMQMHHDMRRAAAAVPVPWIAQPFGLVE